MRLELLASAAALVDALGASGGPLTALVLVGLLGAVTSMVALGIVVLVLALCALLALAPSAPLREEAGTRLLVWQRNPDAAGHIRSRAPGSVLPAA